MIGSRDCGKKNDADEEECETHEYIGIITLHFKASGSKTGASSLLRGKPAKEEAAEWRRFADSRNKQKIYCYILQGEVTTCKLVKCKYYAVCHA